MSAENWITVETQCGSCNGTGLYSGMGERGGLAVVCRTCKGSAKSEVTYQPFTGRKPPRQGVTHVISSNPGVFLNAEIAASSAMTVHEWLSGKQFTDKQTQFRSFQCPHQYTQNTVGANIEGYVPALHCAKNYVNTFTLCPEYERKHLCWAEFDHADALVKIRTGGRET